MSDTPTTSPAIAHVSAPAPDYSDVTAQLPTEGATLAEIVSAINGLKAALVAAQSKLSDAGLSQAQTDALNRLTAFLR